MPMYPGFRAEDWEGAPEYQGPGLSELHQRSGSVILDFESLQRIAAAQESQGAFRSDNGLGAPTAPIKIGAVPAVFLKIASLNEDDFLIHRPLQPEILVVVTGILTIRNSRFASLFRLDADQSGPLHSGNAVALGPEGVRLTAHGLDRQAASLALSIMGMHPEQTDLIIMQNIFHAGKGINPAGRVNLPYED